VDGLLAGLLLAAALFAQRWHPLAALQRGPGGPARAQAPPAVTSHDGESCAPVS